ncbi:MAG TPA: SDR family oxidoreductase [Candidatus Bathyarchaeia archaeon]|nr:SDR family oxidoreductase [Candidatus Bathyarchaeia archaeon]
MATEPAGGKGVVILGATSAIARAAAIELGQRGYDLILASRDTEENQAVASDVEVRTGAKVAAFPFEAEDMSSHPAFFTRCRDHFGGGLAGVILCFGYLDDQKAAERDFSIARRIIDVNYTGAVSILELFAGHFEERRKGFICAVSSVAGDRGRLTNYMYCSAKAGLTTYLEGLRNRLFRSGVPVTTVKPGFVDTKMTFGKPNLMLVAPAEKAAKDIVKAALKGKDVIYTPWFWRYIMLIIQHVPETIFKRLKL